MQISYLLHFLSVVSVGRKNTPPPICVIQDSVFARAFIPEPQKYTFFLDPPFSPPPAGGHGCLGKYVGQWSISCTCAKTREAGRHRREGALLQPPTPGNFLSCRSTKPSLLYLFIWLVPGPWEAIRRRFLCPR